MGKQLEIKVSEEEGVWTIAVSGAVDADSAAQLKQQVLPLCQKNLPRVLMDFSGLIYINSLCMGQLTTYQKTCDAHGGGFAIYGVDGKIFEIMKLIHLDDLVSICASRSEALAAIS